MQKRVCVYLYVACEWLEATFGRRRRWYIQHLLHSRFSSAQGTEDRSLSSKITIALCWRAKVKEFHRVAAIKAWFHSCKVLMPCFALVWTTQSTASFKNLCSEAEHPEGGDHSACRLWAGTHCTSLSLLNKLVARQMVPKMEVNNPYAQHWQCEPLQESRK